MDFTGKEFKVFPVGNIPRLSNLFGTGEVLDVFFYSYNISSKLFGNIGRAITMMPYVN